MLMVLDNFFIKSLHDERQKKRYLEKMLFTSTIINITINILATVNLVRLLDASIEIYIKKYLNKRQIEDVISHRNFS